MRAFFALFLSLTALCAQAQKASFDAVQDGKKVGSLTIDRKIAGSTMTVAVVMDIKGPGPGGSAKIAVTTVYDGKGMPKSKKATISSGGSTGQLSAIFSATGAKVSTTSKGKTQSRELKAPAKSSLVDVGVWWFAAGKSKPKVNATYTYQALSPITLQWSETTTQYLGLAAVPIPGKQVKGHRVVSTRANEKSSTWLDDNGIPWMLDQGRLKFIRR